MSLRIETKAAPDDADYQAILAPLHAYNREQAGLALAEKVAILVNDESGVTNGGLHGKVFGQVPDPRKAGFEFQRSRSVIGLQYAQR